MLQQGLPTQLYMGTKLNVSKFKKPQNSSFWHKPEKGGLWTSTYTPNAEHKSAWVEWCSYEMPHWIKPTGRILEVDSAARVFVIDSFTDLLELFDRYGSESPLKMGCVFDYEKMANDIDGVHLTADGQVETRHSEPINLYGWDCECTLWLTTSVLKDIGQVKLK